MENVVLGIDIGGTTTTVAKVNEAGNILSKHTYNSAAANTFTDYFSQLNSIISEVAGQHRTGLVGIGVGAPAGNYRDGTIRAANLTWARGINLVDELTAYYEVPVTLDNDANATALGEMYFGAAQPYRDFILITLGTGLGSGIVVNGEVVYGHNGLAGELGHICVELNGRDCACGRKGCLETYVSANGLKRNVFDLLARRTMPSQLREVSFTDLTAHQISQAAEAGDLIALEAFDFTGKILGLKLADAVAHTNPEAIILFGGLANAGKLLFEPTAKSLKEHMLFLYNDQIPLLASALSQSDAAVLGAAALAWQKLKKSIVTLSAN